jgi:hypothetical protein
MPEKQLLASWLPRLAEFLAQGHSDICATSAFEHSSPLWMGRGDVSRIGAFYAGYGWLTT